MEEKEERVKEYLGNTNTRVYHLWSCHYRDVILERHKVDTDGDGFRPCGVCKPGLSGLFRQADLLEFGTRNCPDPRAEHIFNETGCLQCGSHHGQVKMHPDNGGYQVHGASGRWWIYFQCQGCGYASSLVKAQHHITRQRVHQASVKQEGK